MAQNPSWENHGWAGGVFTRCPLWLRVPGAAANVCGAEVPVMTYSSHLLVVNSRLALILGVRVEYSLDFKVMVVQARCR